MKRLVSLISMLPLFMVLLVAAPAVSFAAPPSAALLQTVPSESKLVVGVNVPKLRSSFLFAEFLTVLGRLQGDSDILGFILEDAALDLGRDVEAIVLGQPEVSLTPSGVPSEMVVAVEASFDEEKLLAAARTRFGALKSTRVDDAVTVHDTGAFRFAVVGPRRLVFTTRAGGYDTAVWKTVVDDKSGASFSPKLGPLLKLADTERSLWVVALTGHLRQPGVPVADSSIMEIGLDDRGLDATIRSAMTTDDGAAKTLEQMQALKVQNAANPLVEMLGAKPLLSNMTTARDGKTVVLKTSMTEPQLRTMFERLKVMAKQQAAPPAGRAPTTSPAAPPRPPEGGVEADFN